MSEGQVPPPPPPPVEPSNTTAAGAGDYPAPYQGPAPTKDDMNMAMLCHLLAIFTGFIGPLIIWLIKKETSRFVDDQGKEALNFQLTMLIGYVIGMATIWLCIGALICLAVIVVSIIFSIIAALAASKGTAYRYPFALRLIK
jgi:uncharacterized Tic20 family protein